MKLTSQMRKNLLILQSSKPEEKSVEFDAKQEGLKPIHKRNAVCNFFTWLIHKIFPCFVRNRALDRVSQNILKGVEAVDQVTQREKSLIEKAIINLGLMIEKNGGACTELVKNTLLKIQNLPIVKKLTLPAKTPNNNLPQVKKGPEIANPLKLNQDPVKQNTVQASVQELGKKELLENEQTKDQETGKPDASNVVLTKAAPDSTKPLPTPPIKNRENSSTQKVINNKDLDKTEENKPPKLPPLPEKLQNLMYGKDPVGCLFKELIIFAEFLLNYPDDEIREKGLNTIAGHISKIHAAIISNPTEPQINVLTKLFERLSKNIKITLLTKALKDVFALKTISNELLVAASLDQPTIWKTASQQASKTLTKNYTIKFKDFSKLGLIELLPVSHVLAILESVLLKNQDFASEFFEFYFSPKKNIEIQHKFLENINPEFFKFFLPAIDESKRSPWKYFIRVLSSFEDNKKLEKILVNIFAYLNEKKNSKAILHLPIKHTLVVLAKTQQLEHPEYQELLDNLFQDPRFKDEANQKQFVNYFTDDNEINSQILVDILWKTANVHKEFHNFLLAYILEEKVKFQPQMRLKCISNMGNDMIRQYVFPLVNNAAASHERFLKLIPLLRFSEIQTQINAEWDNIKDWYLSPKPQKFINYDQLLPYITNVDRLLELLAPIFQAKDEKYFELIFNHLEEEPWKALFLAGLLDALYPQQKALYHKQSALFNEQQALFLAGKLKEQPLEPVKPFDINPYLSEWLSNQNKLNGDKFFQCEIIFKNGIKLDKPMHEKTEIARFFKIENKFNFMVKKTIFDKFDANIKEYLLTHTRHSSPKDLLSHFLNIHPSQLAMALLDKESRNNILKAIKQEEGFLTETAVEKIAEITKKIKEHLAVLILNNQEKIKNLEQYLLNLDEAAADNPDEKQEAAKSNINEIKEKIKEQEQGIANIDAFLNEIPRKNLQQINYRQSVYAL